jgi:hypothetical protein
MKVSTTVKIAAFAGLVVWVGWSAFSWLMTGCCVAFVLFAGSLAGELFLD